MSEHLNLKDRLEEAKAEVQRIEKALKSATCEDAGHDWISIGGSNAGCNPECSCSVPVFECIRCGASDYGFNDEARVVIRDCEHINGPWPNSADF